MAFEFGMIPFSLIHDVFVKMDLTTLGRMRQTNSRVNGFIEQNRNRIKVRSTVPSVLKISVDFEKMVFVYKVMFKKLKSEELINLSYYLGQISEEEYVIVENPFEQLSIAKFDFIFMDFELNTEGKTFSQIASNMSMQASVLPQLDRLHLQCDWLCMQTSDHSTHLVNDILCKLYFKNIYFEGPCLTRDIEEWPIQHCEQIHVAGVEDVPKRISELINTFSTASIAFKCYGVEVMVKNFLLKIKENPTLVGNLQNLSIYAVELHRLEGLEGLQEIYAYYDKENFLTVSKLKIGDGFVYLKFFEDIFDFKFTDQECDDEIVSAVCYAQDSLFDV